MFDLDMTPAAALADCEATVRRADPDRYLAALFAPSAARPLLYALYAFNHELARAGELARDPMAVEIRLQWWRDVLDAVREGRPPAHPVAVGLAEVLSRPDVQADSLQALVDARDIEGSPGPFATLAAMERHAQSTSACLMRLAAQVIAGADGWAEMIDEAGVAYGITGMLRSFRFHALRGKVFLPGDLLAAEPLSAGDLAAGRNSDRLKRVLDKVALCATDHYRLAKVSRFPSDVLSAVLPASLVPAYLSRIGNGLPAGTDILHLRKPLIMLRAALRRRL